MGFIQHVIRRDGMEKLGIQGKVDDKRRRGSSNRYIDQLANFTDAGAPWCLTNWFMQVTYKNPTGFFQKITFNVLFFSNQIRKRIDILKSETSPSTVETLYFHFY